MTEEQEILLYFVRGGIDDNLDKTIDPPFNIEKLEGYDDLLDFLKEKDEDDTETYEYVENNQDGLYVWGSKEWDIETNDEERFDDFIEHVEDSKKDVYMAFVDSRRKARYMGEVKQVNDIIDEGVNKELSKIFWGDDEEEFTTIWFLDEVESIHKSDKIKEVIEKANNNLNLGFKYYKENQDDDEGLFTPHQGGSNISKIDKDFQNLDEEKLKALKDFLENGELKDIDMVEQSTVNDSEIINEVLENKKQVILYGPPGTGKTYESKDIAVKLLTDKK